jgi:hypothetical protein
VAVPGDDAAHNLGRIDLSSAWPFASATFQLLPGKLD